MRLVLTYLLVVTSVLLLASCQEQSATPASPPEVSAVEGSEQVPLPQAEPIEIRSISDIEFGSYDRELAKFVGLELGEPFTDVRTKLETYFVPGQGIPGEQVAVERRRGHSEVAFSSFSAEGGSVIVAERKEMADDSVKAEQLYAFSKKQADGSEVLIDYGLKIKCWRSPNPDKWRTQPCP